MEKLDQVLAELTQRLGVLAGQYGPDAMGVALWVMQLKSMAWLAWGFALLVVGGVGFCVVYRLQKEIKNSEDGLCAAVILGGIVSAACLIAGTVIFCNPITWAAAFDGRVALAALILEKL